MDSLDHVRDRFDVLKPPMDHGKSQPHALAAPPQIGARRRGPVRTLRLSIAMLLGVLGIALGSVTPVYAHGIQCGDVLGPGGRFELEHDLACPHSSGPAVTIRDGAIFDLQGHLVTCSSGAIGCVLLTGRGAQLLNGAVGAVQHESIVLKGDGGHTVRNVTSEFADRNILVQSDYNQLINVYAASVVNPAFAIEGNHNLLKDTIARCAELSPGACILVQGDANLLIKNFATSTTPALPSSGGGFEVSGNNNRLTGNLAIGSDGPGMVVRGTGNRLTRNTALSNSTDLIDTHADCDANQWRRNIFRTSRAGATEHPGCIQ